MNELRLRPYQTEAIKEVYSRIREGKRRNLIVLPTGSGKSLVAARMMRDCLSKGKRALCVVPRKELLEQNWQELHSSYGINAGIVCAGMKRREFDAEAIIGTVHSLYKWPDLLKDVGLLICDEAHYIKAKEIGMWGKLISGIDERNPSVAIVGLTATPGRLDRGHLCEGEGKLFDEVAFEQPIAKMVEEGFLCRVVSREPENQIDLSNVDIRRGEFVISELEEEAVRVTQAICEEVIELAADRNCWMFFCCSIRHAEFTAETLCNMGIQAQCLTSEQPTDECNRIVKQYKAGELKAICGCEILTTGFNHPPIDMIAFLRATKSASLLVQAVGRGMRPMEGKTDTLLLDYGKNIRRHGPITEITDWGKPVSTKEGEGYKGKKCPGCMALVGAAAKMCDECGFEFPVSFGGAGKLSTRADGEDPMGNGKNEKTILVRHMMIDEHYSFRSALTSLRIDYIGSFEAGFVQGGEEQGHGGTGTEYFCFNHEGYAREKAIQGWWAMGGTLPAPKDTAEAYDRREELEKPSRVTMAREGKYWHVTKRWY